MLRICCFVLLVLSVLVVPGFAALADSAPPPEAAASAAGSAVPAPSTEAEPAASPEAAVEPYEAVELPAFSTEPSFAAAADYVLCSCRLCYAQPKQVCRISPTGFSILCEDYFRIYCS